MPLPSPHMCEAFCNSKTSLTYHKKIIYTIVSTRCGGDNIVRVNNSIYKTKIDWMKVGPFMLKGGPRVAKWFIV